MNYPFPTPPAPGETIEVAPGVKWLRMPLPFALDHINLWLVEERDGATLVDTGYGDDATRSLWETHLATTLAGRAIGRIVVTHYHPDHIGNAAWLAARCHAPIAMTAAEYLTSHAVHGQSAGYGVEDTCALFATHGVGDEYLRDLASRGNRFRHGAPELPMRFQRLFPGATARMGGNDWRVIGGYGHSPEHAALHSPDRGALISGDMLLPRISTNVSVGPAEPEGDPLARFLESLQAFESLPDDTVVLPSHGLPFRGAAARVKQLRQHHDDRLAELVEAVSAAGSASATDIVPVLFRRELDTQQRFFAMGEAIAHLNYLVAAGALDRERDAAGQVRFRRSGEASPA